MWPGQTARKPTAAPGVTAAACREECEASGLPRPIRGPSTQRGRLKVGGPGSTTAPSNWGKPELAAAMAATPFVTAAAVC